MKEYTIYIDRSLPEDGFDICLNKTLTDCDVVVYSIPFRENFAITGNGIEIRSFLEDLLVYKSIYPERVEIEVSSEIDEFLKTSYISAQLESTIDQNIKLSELKDLRSAKENITFNQSVDFLMTILTKFNSGLKININPAGFDLEKYFSIESVQTLDICTTKAIFSEKEFSALSGVLLGTSLDIHYSVSGETKPFGLAMNSSVLLSSIRYRTLEELDILMLDDIDNMALEELDIVTID